MAIIIVSAMLTAACLIAARLIEHFIFASLKWFITGQWGSEQDCAARQQRKQHQRQ